MDWLEIENNSWEMQRIEIVLMTTENNPGQLFTAVDVDFTNITKHRDISQMNRSKPFQQFDPEKTSFLFRNLLYCKDKDANVVIK